MSREPIFATCPSCKSRVGFDREKDVDYESAKAAESQLRATIAEMLDAGRKEKKRRDLVENDLRNRISELESTISWMQDNRRTN